MSKKIAVVSGSNSGIGLAIVRALCKQFGDNGVVYLTARNEGRGQEAVEVLKKEGLNPSFHLLDVNDVGSMETLRDFIKGKHGGLDILVNNAGIAYKGNDTPMSEQAAGSIKTNYHGVLLMTNTFLPILQDGGRIVHVASLVAPMTFNRMSEEVKKKFREVSTEQGVTDLMNEFIELTKTGNHVKMGWPDWAYGVSKLGVTTLTRLQGQRVSQDASKKDVLINCCCPGYVVTGMTAHHSGENAKKRIGADEGADTPVYLSLLPPGTTGLQGKFLSKRKVVEFYDQDVGPISF